MTTPVAFRYQQALVDYRRGGGDAAPLLKRMSELVSLLDLTATLGAGQESGEAMEAALLAVMGELQVARGALYLAGSEGFELRAGRGLPDGAPARLDWDGRPGPLVPEPDGAAARAGLALVWPVRRADRCIALLALGPRAGGRPFGPDETGFLDSVAACAATPIENGRVHAQLRRVNETLSMKVFQLESLFDLGRELTTSLDETAIGRLATAAMMGHFLASRCALYRFTEGGGLVLSDSRGLRASDTEAVLPVTAERLGVELPGPRRVDELEPGALRDALVRGRFAIAVPLAPRGGGVLAVSEPQTPYGEPDLDFASALARQTQAALESARLHRVQLQMERQDRDLQIAREIQLSLFPLTLPRIEGFELAALNRSCYEVGGDYYDAIPLEGGRLAIVIADVSGKGTPASIMMASVHASLEAMAGSSPPARLLQRLNRFLFERTQASRYVTLFYGELDPVSRALVYVNAGHVPPYLLRRDGREQRLRTGGPVIGLLEEVVFETGELLLEPGDLLTIVTDGVTEAASPALCGSAGSGADAGGERSTRAPCAAGEESGAEFGDERAIQALRSSGDADAQAALAALVQAVDRWAGAAGCSDDLTILTLKAT